MFWKIKRIHFIGIGGTGMSGIAEVLFNLGFKVQGSDLKKSPYTERLEKLGIKIFYGHSSQNVKDADLVVISSAINESNEEYKEALRLKIPVIKRGEMLAELMRMKYGIAVSGTHGKTTTTAIAASVLNEAGFDPTVIIGGIFQNFNSNVKLGKSQFLLAEADESDKSHLKLFPVFAVITNIDLDHLDVYRDIEDIKSTFAEFASKVPFFGSVILNADDKNSADIVPLIKKRVVMFGFSPNADYRIANVKAEKGRYLFEIFERDKSLGEFCLKVPGRFNIQNSAAVIALARELEIDVESIRKGIEAYTGTKRRCEIVGKNENIKVITDYAHHPVEIETTLNAISEFYHTKKILAVFQPHRYTRTYALFDKFVSCFPKWTDVVLLPVYPAGESPIEGVSSEVMCSAIGKRGINCFFAPDKETLFEYLKSNYSDYDIVVFLGAGYIDFYAREFGEYVNG